MLDWMKDLETKMPVISRLSDATEDRIFAIKNVAYNSQPCEPYFSFFTRYYNKRRILEKTFLFALVGCNIKTIQKIFDIFNSKDCSEFDNIYYGAMDDSLRTIEPPTNVSFKSRIDEHHQFLYKNRQKIPKRRGVSKSANFHTLRKIFSGCNIRRNGEKRTRVLLSELKKEKK
eukprot:gb/GECH01008349.1/.p1 GENE.gb/GECH01008349.1/~~gb/GECH01008349.1/.p1  ORF type:complete len:173 (+),score=7.52 gb/GECH01008349.1/:1-519(+)